MYYDNTEVTYCENTVSSVLSRYSESSAGAICTFKRNDVIFSGHSFVTFIGNTADRAGAVTLSKSNVIIGGFSTVKFDSNIALYSSGGAIECSNNSNITIKGSSTIMFNSKKASGNGGAVYLYNIYAR